VRELHLLFVGQLVHRVIDDPGELEDVLFDQVELCGDDFAHAAEDLGGFGFVVVGGEEDDCFAKVSNQTLIKKRLKDIEI
jgi:hypothetical protein